MIHIQIFICEYVATYICISTFELILFFFFFHSFGGCRREDADHSPLLHRLGSADALLKYLERTKKKKSGAAFLQWFSVSFFYWS